MKRLLVHEEPAQPASFVDHLDPHLGGCIVWGGAVSHVLTSRLIWGLPTGAPRASDSSRAGGAELSLQEARALLDDHHYGLDKVPNHRCDEIMRQILG